MKSKLKDYIEVRNWVEEFIPLVWGKEELGLARIKYLLALLGNPEKKFKSIHVAGTSGKGSTAYYIAQLLSSVNYKLQITNYKRKSKANNSKLQNVILGSEATPESPLFADSGQSQNDKKRLKIGLHISPHLVDIRERMQILSQYVIPAQAGIQRGKILDPFEKSQGKQVEDDNSLMPMGRFLKLFKQVRPVVEKIQKTKPELVPSYFEILVAASFKYFAEEKVDWAVVEVGLGGRLDATNVLMPEVSVITNIGLDHTEILGDTIEKIAFEKAGIIKPGVPVVTGATGEAMRVIEKVAKEKKAPLYSSSGAKRSREVKGKFSTSSNNNLTMAEKAVEVALSLRAKSTTRSRTTSERSNLKIDRRGHQDDLAMTIRGLPGRFEEIEEGVILDGAHNPDKIQALLEFIRKSFFLRHSRVNENPDPRFREDDSMVDEVVLALAFKQGKDWKMMIDLLIKNLPVKEIIATQYQAVTDTGKGSAVDPGEIRDYVAKVHSVRCKVISNSQEAVFEVLRFAQGKLPNIRHSGDERSEDSRIRFWTSQNDRFLVLVTGSLYLVGEVRTMWQLPTFA